MRCPFANETITASKLAARTVTVVAAEVTYPKGSIYCGTFASQPSKVLGLMSLCVSNDLLEFFQTVGLGLGLTDTTLKMMMMMMMVVMVVLMMIADGQNVAVSVYYWEKICGLIKEPCSEC